MMPIVALVIAGVGGVSRTPAAATPRATGPWTDVIVTQNGGTTTAVERLVTAAGGRLERQLPLVNGFAATVPVSALPALASAPSVRSITPNGPGHLLSIDPTLGYDQNADEGSLSFVSTLLSAQNVWKAGITGKGVDVALVDSGVAQVPGLASGNVVNGPDLSFESQHADVRYVDTFGHGTHLASIIAGRDTAGTPASYVGPGQFDGIAPDARIVSLKVAASDGSADVSQVIAAIGWVTQHAHDNGLNVRVLNLSYGTSSTQSWILDPLSYAVEQAWKHGIVVVVAAGNDGTTTQALADPAINPYVLAVGADDPNNSLQVKDGTVPVFAQRGTAGRFVDVIAPGVHILGLRDTNGYVDQTNPGGRVGTRFMRGSGTSQAAAVVSGVAALVLQRYPTATPDQVKYLIMSSASKFKAGKDIWKGLGVVNASTALYGANPQDAPVQNYQAATGTGTIEGARGGSHVALGGVTLTGEKDIFGQAWVPTTWASAIAANTSWSGGSYNGSAWTGTGWAAPASWSAATWAGVDWTGSAWTSRTWFSRTWFGNGWDSRTWYDSGWDSRTWYDANWSAATWS